MRIAPRPGVAIGIFLVYAAIVATLWAINGVDYDTLGDTKSSIVDAIIVPVGIGAVFLAASASWLGWWRPALFEERRSGPRWALWVPFLVFLVGLISAISIDWDSPRTDVLLLLAIGVLLVGFSEEMVTRGLMIVGLRGGLREPIVWLVSSALFGLLHGLNVFFGQGAGPTVVQIVAAFVIGSAFYVTRRVTGTLIVCMLLHALWDFGSIGVQATDGSSLGGIFLWPAGILTFVVLWKMFRSTERAAESDRAQADPV